MPPITCCVFISYLVTLVKIKTMNEYTNESNVEVTSNPVRDKRRRRKDIFPGLFILLIGVVFLMRQTGVIFPHWFFTWPVLLIGIGVFSGIRHGYRNGGWLIPIIIGGLYLINEMVPGMGMGQYIWPIVIIAVGLLLIIRPKKSNHWVRWQQQHWHNSEQWTKQQDGAGAYNQSGDYLDITAIFGGVKKIILSKSFKGGDITSLMGGTEVNLTQADINGVVTIDATSIFGGTKLIVPPTWDVQSEVVTIFGGVDDKRQINSEALNPGKVLRLEGTCIFGGIDIRSY